jgi:hypothetical protein
VSYGYETWSATLREEHRLRVYENRVLGRILGLKGDTVKKSWRKSAKSGAPQFSLFNNYYYDDRIKNGEIVRHVARMG